MIHSGDMKRFFRVEEHNAPDNNALYFRDYLGRSILTSVGRTNIVSGEGKKESCVLLSTE